MTKPVIDVRQLTVELPVLSVQARSLRRSLVHAAGGNLFRGAHDRVVVRALHEVCLSIHEGERLGLVGHNGSGKSTLLRTLAGIYRPSSGMVELRGRCSAALDPMAGMDGEVSGEENVVLLARYRGYGRRQALAALPAIAEFTELGAYMQMPVKTYSLGMAMRLAFAVATSFEPDILLMDEWIAAADHHFAEKARARLSSYFGRARAVVIATHDESLIRRLCTRVVVLEGGRVKSAATTMADAA